MVEAGKRMGKPVVESMRIAGQGVGLNQRGESKKQSRRAQSFKVDGPHISESDFTPARTGFQSKFR